MEAEAKRTEKLLKISSGDEVNRRKKADNLYLETIHAKIKMI